jgi:nucleotide-binding universal stress UspA family protein
MYKRIVVAVGDYPELDTALEYAIALAADSDAELSLLRVCTVPLIFGALDMVTCSHLALENVMEAHTHLLACAAAAAEEAGVSYTTTARWGAIPDLLMRTADEVECDVIVVGSPASPGWPWPYNRYLARQVMARARQPVLVVSQPPPASYGGPLWSRMLVVHDGSPGADMAVEYALTLADTACLDTCILRLRTGGLSHKVPCLRPAMKASTARSIAGTHPALAESNDEILAPWGGISSILETATERRCDVIVLGTHQGRSWQRLWYGHLARGLMAMTDLPLLVVNRFAVCRYA